VSLPFTTNAQDTTKSKFDPNESKLVKKVNKILDTASKRITNKIINKARGIAQKADTQVNKITNKNYKLVEQPLPYERLLKKKYTLLRRGYQNTVSQYNYFFNATEEMNDIILKARNSYQEDYSSLLNFYDYDLTATSKYSIDSIIYRCNANIVLHDLRSNWVDDSYLLLAKAYLFHKNFDTAGSILQFINYSFDTKENGMDLPIGSNIRKTNGKFSIATKEDQRFFENANVRNESMVWQARNYLEIKEYNEAISLLQLLKADELFPKRLHPFLNEQLAYAYYLTESYDNAATNLINALPNAPDHLAKARWFYLIAQLWQKVNKIDNAYTWFKKANEYAPNPIIGVYSKINMIRIESIKSNRPWEQLANDLESMTKKERYKPFSDIIYFEMAQLAIQHHSINKANDWLVKSIKYNDSNPHKKQSAFELLGSINYENEYYGLSKMAYDSISNLLKTNPQYENIMLRKKWMRTINEQTNAYQLEDSLEYIYNLPKEIQSPYAIGWNKRQTITLNNLANLFKDKPNKYNLLDDASTLAANNSISFTGSNNGNNDFYFDNKNIIKQGKQSFVQKWGERPNVDQWRRKTSATVVNATMSSNTSKRTNDVKDTSDIVNKKKTEKETTKYSLLASKEDYNASLNKWNKAALATAQTFMLQLNDFEKAKPIYQKIIDRHIDSAITERAYLDLASEYLHIGNIEKSNELIKIVLNKFPKGTYASKKLEEENKRNKNTYIINQYKEAYFSSQIGDWTKLANIAASIGDEIQKTKWHFPLQFLKVKMYAQQKQDSLAIALLENIIAESKSDIIKEKAKNIITEIKNRKDTEAYLTSLQIVKEQYLPESNPITLQNAIRKADSLNNKKDSTILNTNQKLLVPKIAFDHDSSAPHFVALVTNNLKTMFVKEMQNALSSLNVDEFANLKLNATFVQFQEGVYIVWVGPFDNLQKSKNYLNKIKPRLKNEIISFVNEKQYEIYLISKPNILLIKSTDDLALYKDFMLNKIYKP
jgi:tetratricopeptide (TPR) repeat protein